MQIARQKKTPMGMDMSPLIDCVFQLLIFFMLSSTFLTPAIGLSLPQASTTEAADPIEIVITVTSTGDLYLNKNQVSLDSLTAELQLLLANSKHKVVTFRGDKDLRYELFVEALEAAKKAGAESFDIAHETPPAR